MGLIEARVREDGSCELYDLQDRTSVAEWSSVAEWAQAWINEWRTEDFDVASEFAHAVTEEGGPHAIEVLLTLARATDGDVGDLGLVGAGPLEDLISHEGHGLRLLDEIETAARREPLFARAMTSVWLAADVPETVRRRLAIFGARDFVAEQAMSLEELTRYRADRFGRGWS